MLTRQRQAVKINPPERFREAKAQEKVLQNYQGFKKPRGRPSRASQATNHVKIQFLGVKRTKKTAFIDLKN